MTIVSNRVRYALHGLAFLARHGGDGEPVPFEMILAYLRSYSPKLILSPTYIAKIFQQVSRAGLTIAVSGPHGGYRLARVPEEISLIEIVEALDGPLRSECCLLSTGSCPQDERCGVRHVIQEAELAFYRFFEEQSLASLERMMVFPQLEGSGSSNGDSQLIQIAESDSPKH